MASFLHNSTTRKVEGECASDVEREGRKLGGRVKLPCMHNSEERRTGKRSRRRGKCFHARSRLFLLLLIPTNFVGLLCSQHFSPGKPEERERKGPIFLSPLFCLRNSERALGDVSVPRRRPRASRLPPLPPPCGSLTNRSLHFFEGNTRRREEESSNLIPPPPLKQYLQV